MNYGSNPCIKYGTTGCKPRSCEVLHHYPRILYYITEFTTTMHAVVFAIVLQIIKISYKFASCCRVYDFHWQNCPFGIEELITSVAEFCRNRLLGELLTASTVQRYDISQKEFATSAG